ncbi:hypothetical protein UA08_08494 [Talaromyces atroroseus]|uniref:YMC020W-like alpha/beta hydrolase domain-containing protein n=1 Tax=Talaromyces atroroseus TaxID=1441469 RepID=A0A1Q5Q7Q4_TALAT|nr:hypothetical protein UA08_08494 [Talaromyces atroroseus]OKL56151.1 hypothetical protein UA08_08494 [Talaromyces atroroseus]
MGSRKELKSPHLADNSPVNRASNDGSSGPTQSTPDNGSPLRKQDSRLPWTSKTWPHGRKAAAVTEVARESISVSGNIASESSTSTTGRPQFRSPNRSGSIQLIRKAGASSNRSLPADVTTTRINIDSNGSTSSQPGTKSSPDLLISQAGSGEYENNTNLSADADSTGPGDDSKVQAPENTENTTRATKVETELVTNEQPASTWFGWLGFGKTSTDKSDLKESEMGKTSEIAEPTPASIEEPQPLEAGTKFHEADEEYTSGNTQNTIQQIEETRNSVPQKRSWLQIWGSTNVTSATSPKEDSQKEDSVPNRDLEQERPSTETDRIPPVDQLQTNNSQKRTLASGKSSGWSFWSKDVSNTEQTPGSESQAETGELVLPEQPKVKSNPEDIAAQFGSSPSSVSALKSKVRSQKKRATSITVKDIQPVDVPEDSVTSTSTTQTSTAQIPTKPQITELSASTKLETVLTNQLLPSFRDTFALQESPSWLQTLGRMIYTRKESDNRHVSVLRDPPRPKKALAIGVHGYFPAPYLRTVLGQPTGTSLKFSTMAAKAIHKWTENHGYHCDVEKIALEGEGRIAERVDLLWKLLLRWIEEIRKAEFIMFACHSQGVPVTIMLVAKLIAFGCLESTRVGICAMAGVNLGPIPDYKSRWIGGSAGELFDFALPTTKVSREYEMALKDALEFGVRISYVGSIDDQLVSLESSLFVPISHPYIYRAVFVDGRVHAPSFLSHLVGFTLKLRNLGIHDHGLIRELSAPLVGSLVGGEGHSRLHDEENIYYVAVEFALETSNVNGASLHIQRHYPSSSPNPYILPFALRGLLEEDYVRHELHDESLELLKQFDEWKPATKVLRDVKFRLEGIRSKL